MIDLAYSERQTAAAGLAQRVLADFAGPEQLEAAEASAAPLDKALWDALASAGLLDVWISEAADGAGGGLSDLCAVLLEQGRLVVHTPLLAAGIGSLYLDRVAARTAPAGLLGAATSGTAIVVPALAEPGVDRVTEPRTTATASGAILSLTGHKISVPAGAAATHFLVGHGGRGGRGVALVAADADGVTVTPARTTDRGWAAHVELDAASGIPLGDGTALQWLFRAAVVAHCAVQAGVMEAMTKAAAEYTSTRTQFGRPLTYFQTVLKRGADAYIDTRAVRATMWHAAWLLDTAGPEADVAGAVSIAKWWASEAGHRTAHSMLYLHGGLGNDLTYPVHRYYLWAKQIDATLGGPTQHLELIGEALVG